MDEAMVKSMTGYGRCQAMEAGRDITVEIKSVNHRYFEFSCRTSRGYGFLEERLKAELQKRVSRGKVDVYVSVNTVDEQAADVLVNHALAAGYVAALQELCDRYALEDDISVSTVARYADVFTVQRAPEDEDEVWTAVLKVAEPAMDSLVGMREAEGARMRDDVLGRAQTILSIVDEIESKTPTILAEFQEKLKARLVEMLGDIKIDEGRLLTEAAIFADRVATAEETVRLRSHFKQFEGMLKTDEAVGRKLDFIVQEMNREVNTIGSKAQDARVAHLVVTMKSELEKIREQIQNIE